MSELDKKIGTKEHSRLTAGSVIVNHITIEEKPTRKGGKAKLVVFHVKHQDQPELVKLSNIKLKVVQGNNETIKKDTLWYNEDSEGNIDKSSCVAKIMNCYNKKTLKEFENSSINTEVDAQGYLCIKAY